MEAPSFKVDIPKSLCGRGHGEATGYGKRLGQEALGLRGLGPHPSGVHMGRKSSER